MNGAHVALLAAALVADLAANLPLAAGGEGGGARLVLATTIDGAIGPASARQLEEALALSAERGAEALILQLNTPGGLVTSMREMIADILASPVPVVGYVAPAGGHAASAGTYILYATHVAAMAPGTNIGAATPVELGGPQPTFPGGSDKNNEDAGQKDGKGPPPSGDAMAAKETNDAVALIRSLAELRGRNADWGEKAVREAASLSANAALQQRVIDIVARNSDELLKMVDGRVVEVGGEKRTLATRDVTVEAIEPGWFIELLSIITNPNIALMLMMVGLYGLVFEFASPGAVAPGVAGTICLLLGLYALNLLPINYTGLALMLLGLVFLVVETFNPTVVLGLGGVGAFLLGAAMLLRIEGPGFELSWFVTGGAAALTLGFAVLTGSYLWAIRRKPSPVGAEAMRGLPARIVDWSDGEGHVLAQGELWRARGEEDFKRGDSVEVKGIQGLVLSVGRSRVERNASE
ncbi:MAG TPA: nodulation protein NfeD [Rhizobiaceae bacterium]|nr:nodulation protein NfeD [Rhizobiaceae bacterium]